MIAAVIEGVQPLLANVRSRSGWAVHRAAEDQLEALAEADARVRRNRAAPIPAPVVATLIVSPPTHDRAGRRRAPTSYPDLDGYSPTFKRMLDGVVRAGVIANDQPTIVTEVRTRQTQPGPQWRLELHVTPDLWEAFT
jgi:Holliday junction resolvase RusA-like endonuclease